jgi:glycosyltransferase involved in cell wall biosynthesis
MNILIDAHIFDDKFQGTRTYIKGLYSALTPLAKDWNFYFVANDINNLQKEFGTGNNIHYISLNSKNKYYRLLIDLPKIIKKNKIDIAHYQYISPFIKNTKNIVTTHDILFKEKRFKNYFPLKYRVLNDILFKMSAKKADVLLTVSEYSRNKIAQYYKIPLKDIFVTPNAVSDDFSCNNNSNSIKEKYNLDKYILYVSRIEPRKNHIILLQAYTELKLWEEGYKLVFIGLEDIISQELNGYKNNYKKLLKDNVLWLEGIAHEELKCFYKNSDLFVFPSFAEGFGIPPLEAISMGKKVLCSNTTAMQDFEFPENMTFNPSDVNELKMKIKILLSNEFSDITKVKEELLIKYNWASIANNFYNLISSEMRKSNDA